MLFSALLSFLWFNYFDFNVVGNSLGFSSFGFLLLLCVHFSYLVAATGLQCLWSCSLAIVDVYALLVRRTLQNHRVVCLFTLGDGVRIKISCNSIWFLADFIVFNHLGMWVLLVFVWFLLSTFRMKHFLVCIKISLSNLLLNGQKVIAFFTRCIAFFFYNQ